jgi:hypothetical protein
VGEPPELEPETETERRIMDDPEWQEGVRWGRPRRGHPEGSVLAHVHEVLGNVDRLAGSPEERARLRLIALVHDSFKSDVDRSRPRTGSNQHGAIARRFAERHVDDPGVLLVVEHHDVPYAFWRHARRTGEWDDAARHARALAAALGDDLDLFLRFYRADNATGDKGDDDLRWFERVVTG